MYSRSGSTKRKAFRAYIEQITRLRYCTKAKLLLVSRALTTWGTNFHICIGK